MTARAMLDWQYRQLLGELQQVQLHASDPTCPCTLSDRGEYCLPKHSLNVSTLAAETAAMDPKNAGLLYKLAISATEMHETLRKHVCGKGKDVDAVEWSRKWRKKVEALYYSCGTALRQSYPLTVCESAVALAQGLDYSEDWESQRVDPHSFTAAQAGMERPEFLTDYTEEELVEFELYLSPSGKAGYGLTPDGELVNLFNNGAPKGEGARLVLDAIARGATHLNCFAPRLVEYYQRFDFAEYNRVRWNDEFTPKGWNHERYGRPDIAYMQFAGRSRDVADTTSRYEAVTGQRAPWRRFSAERALSHSGEVGQREGRGPCAGDTATDPGLTRVCSATGRIGSPDTLLRIWDALRNPASPHSLLTLSISPETPPRPDSAIVMPSEVAMSAPATRQLGVIALQSLPLLTEIARQVCGAGLCSDIPVCSRADAKKLRSCVSRVSKDSSRAEDPYVVCVRSVGCRPAMRRRVRLDDNGGRIERVDWGGKFALGMLAMTRGVSNRVAGDPEFAKFALQSLRRHGSGDWGDLNEEDRRENEFSVDKFLRLFSAYNHPTHPKIWIITEADRSVTTILFPEEY